MIFRTSDWTAYTLHDDGLNLFRDSAIAIGFALFVVGVLAWVL